jgi:hypothetical protein
MNLIEQAKKDIERITTDCNGFGVEIRLIAPTGEEVKVVGRSNNIHLSVNPISGEVINSRNASVSISEAVLTKVGYRVRNESGEVFLKKHIVLVKDSSGREGKFMVKEWYQDQTVGLIVMILGSYE